MSRALLAGLVDDAAVFPPGSAPMPVAVPAHRYHLAAPYAELIGPFLCPLDRVGELRAELRAGDRLAVGLIAGPDRAGLADAVAAVQADGRLHLDRVELPLDAGGPAATVAAVDPLLAPDLPVWVELPWADPGRSALAELQARQARRAERLEWPERAEWPERPVYPKFRTGGAVVPPVGALAERIAACHHGVPLPFKCTAGLHSAVRHDDAHGFLNVLVASGVAARGGPVDEVAAALAETSADRLVAGLREVDTRGAFRSFGSCSVTEPLADLAALGLWSPS
ncbi:MAG: hypothetical protein ACJ73E_11040 [Mycobacteriales bacterium]